MKRIAVAFAASLVFAPFSASASASFQELLEPATAGAGCAHRLCKDALQYGDLYLPKAAGCTPSSC